MTALQHERSAVGMRRSSAPRKAGVKKFEDSKENRVRSRTALYFLPSIYLGLNFARDGDRVRHRAERIFFLVHVQLDLFGRNVRNVLD